MEGKDSLIEVRDWTTSVDGRSNSSMLFNDIANEIARLLRDSAHDLIGGRTYEVGRLILAQLAHKHGLAPDDGAVDLEDLSPGYEGRWHKHHVEGYVHQCADCRRERRRRES